MDTGLAARVDGAADAAPFTLEMRNVTKTFGPVVANRDVSLSLRRGEVLGLLGENGAGKSTLMKILYGLYKPDAGEILIDGERVDIRSPQDAVGRGIGMVHQEFTLVPPLTVAENIVLGAEPGSAARFDRAGAERRVDELAGRFGLRVDSRRKVASLSVGVNQRVEILKALYRDARILVLDEPTAVLTPQEGDELFAVLRSLVEQGLSIILITHKLRELVGVTDRITVLRDGAVVDTVVTAETGEAELARLMVGRDVVTQTRARRTGPAGDVVLEARRLSVTGERGLQALSSVDLVARAGEIVGVAGVDGNGQTELAEALAGVRPVDGGSIALAGVDVTRLLARDRFQRGLAYVPDDRKHTGLVQDLTVWENLALKRHGSAPFARRGWLRSARVRAFAEQRVRDFDVRPPRVLAPVRSLSGGNQQKLILARELSGASEVIVAAQPTRGLDVGAIEYVHRTLLEERDRGAAIVLISFELDEIRALADRIVVLYGGRIVGEAANEDVGDEQLGLWMAGVEEAAA